MSAACVALALLSAAILTGCSTTPQSSNPATPTPVFVAKPAAPPVLNFCADPNRPPDAIASKTGYTQMTVLVSDQSGQPITGLTKSDFVAWTGKHRLPIVFFRSDRIAAPVSVVVLIDISGSMNRKIGSNRFQLVPTDITVDAAVGELNQCDEAAIVTTGGVKDTDEQLAGFTAGKPIRINASPSPRITVMEPFTTGQISPMKYLDRYSPYGESAIYDAVDEAARMLSKAHYRHRAIILVSDGMDNASEATLKHTIAAARRRGVRIFVVGMGNPAVKKPSLIVGGPFMLIPSSPDTWDAINEANLQALASSTGGAFFIAQDVNKDNGASLAAALRKIIDTLGTGYTIGVLAPPQKGSETLLPNVGVVNDPTAVVHAYAEPPAQPHPSTARHIAASAAQL